MLIFVCSTRSTVIEIARPCCEVYLESAGCNKQKELKEKFRKCSHRSRDLLPS